MATNVLGCDFSGLDDFDGFFSDTSDDIQLASQYLYAILITGGVLDSEAPAGWRDWGANVYQYLGAPMSAEAAAAIGPQIEAVIRRDEEGPIEDVTVTVTASGDARFDIIITIAAQIAAGPLRLVVGVSSTLATVLSE